MIRSFERNRKLSVDNQTKATVNSGHGRDDNGSGRTSPGAHVDDDSRSGLHPGHRSVLHLRDLGGHRPLRPRPPGATRQRPPGPWRGHPRCPPTAPGAPFEEVASTGAEEKQAIGRRAAALVSSGDTVIMDVGTTTTAVSRALMARQELTDVVVVTNGLNIALEFEAAMPRFSVIVTGGTVRPLQHSLVSPFAGLVLEQLNADILFLGCNGDPHRGGRHQRQPARGRDEASDDEGRPAHHRRGRLLEGRGGQRGPHLQPRRSRPAHHRYGGPAELLEQLESAGLEIEAV
jgi:hypothetical protein